MQQSGSASRELFHPVQTTGTYASVILPLALPKLYTYYVPEEWLDAARPGVRVEVQFGKRKIYAGLLREIHHRKPDHETKPLLSVLDEQPLVGERHLSFWEWIAEYYCCSLGEVMDAALPAPFKLSSRRKISLSPFFDRHFEELSEAAHLLVQALQIQKEVSIDEVRKILNRKTVGKVLQELFEKRLIYMSEEVKETYRPRMVRCVRLAEPYRSQPELLSEAFEQCARSLKQTEALMAFVQLSKQQQVIRCQEIYDRAGVNSAVLRALEKKGILELYEKQASRLGGYEEELVEVPEMSEQQQRALTAVEEAFGEKDVVLLHGVTGSGKTRLYVELIKKTLARGRQVLYLLPEVGLTTQIVQRLQQLFGDQVAVYHHRLNQNERVEMWRAVAEGQPVVLGARSALFLPFRELGLVIVDEEHDPSFKQHDPAPRYQGRDAAVYLAHLFGAKTLLGTATPSLESYYNARRGKYALVEMLERFGGVQLPEIQVVDAREELLLRKLKVHFTSTLLEEITQALEKGEQVILFRNRRGYAPILKCAVCGWQAGCKDCDVSLTYHKFQNRLQCHYCGHQEGVPTACPACGSAEVRLLGFGTEKIEDELKIYFPEANIQRMDFDAVRSRNAYVRIINDFEEKRIDILVGTQMVTKGLDFENVGLVGVMSADQILQFPHFRSAERGFQLMTQVAGRAGRKQKRGKVIIQAFRVDHPVLREVLDGDYQGFFQREIRERRAFQYPPFSRLIQLTLKHKDPQVLNNAMRQVAERLKAELGRRVLGPGIPPVGRIRGQYLLELLLKLEPRTPVLRHAKTLLLQTLREMQQTPGFTTVRAIVDVDPN